MSATQLFSISSPRLPAGTLVLGFKGHEAISRPYRYEVFLLVPEGSVSASELRRALGARATLALHRDDGDVRRVVHGILTSLEFLHTVESGEAMLRATLAPALWRLSLAQRNRVWVDETLPDILRAVLREGELGDAEVEFRLENPDRYARLDHVCQYRETHLDFVSRRMEADGLYYAFEQPERGAAERLVITDSRSFVAPLSRDAVRYVPVQPGREAGRAVVEGLRTFSLQCAAVSSGVTTRGHDYLHTQLGVAGAAAVEPGGRAVVNELDPTRDPARARRVAQIRAEEVAARQAVARGEGCCYDLRPGYTFELGDHPLMAGEYLVTATEVEGFDQAAYRSHASRLGFGDEAFRVAVEAIPAEVQFRPARVTPVPRVVGVELGVVVGPAQRPYAPVDAHGRYPVRLLFDDDATRETPSVPMRMAQAHAGAGESGFHMPLRDGTQVLVSFLRGDPDMPVIAGAVPTGETPSPVTGANRSKNVVQTGGGNRLVMEDLAGAQYIKWSTPYKNTSFHMGAPHNPTGDIQLSTGGTAIHQTGDDHETEVSRNQRTFVAGKVWEEYGPRPPGSVTRAAPVPPDGYPQVFTHTLRVHGHRDLFVSQNVNERFEGEQTTRVIGKVTHEYGPPGASDPYESMYERTVHGDQRTLVRGKTIEVHDGGYEVVTKGQRGILNFSHRYEQTTGDDTSIFGGANTEVVAGVKTDTVLGGRVDTTALFHMAIELCAFVSFDVARIELTLLEVAKVKFSARDREMEAVKSMVSLHDAQLDLHQARLAIHSSEIFMVK